MRGSKQPFWMIIAVLGAVLLAGIGLLGIRLRPYVAAKYWGGGASLRGARLSLAPLHGAYLQYTDLYRADLTGADLRGADLHGAGLSCARRIYAEPISRAPS